MAEVIIDPSCVDVDLQLEPYRQGTITPTIICGVLAVEAGEVALVRTLAAEGTETPEQSLRPVQTGVHHGEKSAQAFIRKTGDDLEITARGLYAVHGIATHRKAHVFGRPGKEKAFALMCGAVDGRPKLSDRTQRGFVADWFTFDEAEAAFQIQAAKNTLRIRGRRNLLLLHGMRQLRQRLLK